MRYPTVIEMAMGCLLVLMARELAPWADLKMLWLQTTIVRVGYKGTGLCIFRNCYICAATANMAVVNGIIPVPESSIGEDLPSWRKLGKQPPIWYCKIICGFPVVLFKASDKPVACGLQTVLTAIRQSSTVPRSWWVHILLWKEKEDHWKCINHRGTALLRTLDKVLAHILLARITNHILRH